MEYDLKCKWYYFSLPSLDTMELESNYFIRSEKEVGANGVDLQLVRDVLRSKNENIFKQMPEIIDPVITAIKIKIV